MADVNAFFTEFLPNKLQENPDLCSEINAVYQFDMGDDGVWAVDLTGETGTVSEGPHDEPGCVVTIAKEDFETLLDNPSAGMMLFAQGKLQVSDVGLALSLQKLLS